MDAGAEGMGTDGGQSWLLGLAVQSCRAGEPSGIAPASCAEVFFREYAGKNPDKIGKKD